MHTVRKHILELLKEKDSATVAELAGWLEMPAVSVRHHLDVLQGDNLICVDRLERKGNVGRPQQVYALTTEAADYFPDNFAALAAGLVRQLKNVLPPEQVEAAFRGLAADLAAELDPEMLNDLSTEERLTRVAEFLTARGYLARWEHATAERVSGGDETGGNNTEADATAAGDQQPAAEGGYLLHKCNCPYADMADEHPELCLMDKALIDLLLGQTCTRTQSMTDDARCCTYRIDVPGAEPDTAGQAVAPQRIELLVTA